MSRRYIKGHPIGGCVPAHIGWTEHEDVMTGGDRPLEVVAVGDGVDLGSVNPKLKPSSRPETWSAANDQVTLTISRQKRSGSQAEHEGKGENERSSRADHIEL